MAEGALAGLPRLVRVVPELRFRGQTAVALAIVTATFAGSAWLLGAPLDGPRAGGAFAAVALPTLAVSLLTREHRVGEAVRRTLPPPRSSVHETLADARERRTRLSGVVITGVLVLLMFDTLTEGGGLMAGLVAGLFGALGAVDWIDAIRLERVEARRETRLFVIVRPHALSAGYGTVQIYEIGRPDRARPAGAAAGPFDLGGFP